MARIIFTAIVDTIRGSIAGTTFQSNKYGHSIKRKPCMRRPNSHLQNQSKVFMSIVTRTWRTMTQAQRDAYDTWAATYPQYAKHNPSAVLSGYAVFVKFNCLFMLSVGQVRTTGLTAPPAPDTLSYSVDVTAGVLKIFVDSLNDDEAWYILFFASRPFTGSQKFIGTAPRYVGYMANADGALNITTAYTNLFGDIPAVGDNVAVDALVIGDNAPMVLARDSQVYTIVTGT